MPGERYNLQRKCGDYLRLWWEDDRIWPVTVVSITKDGGEWLLVARDVHGVKRARPVEGWFVDELAVFKVVEKQNHTMRAWKEKEQQDAGVHS